MKCSTVFCLFHKFEKIIYLSDVCKKGQNIKEGHQRTFLPQGYLEAMESKTRRSTGPLDRPFPYPPTPRA